MLLSIKNLKASVQDKQIVKGLSLNIIEGETHAIMGPNGSGKSTLASIIMGHPAYTVDAGEILFEGENIIPLTVTERAKRGVFLVFQTPRSISGLPLSKFLHTIYKSKILSSHGVSEEEAKKDKIIRKSLSYVSFLQVITPLLEEVKLPDTFLQRSLNDGFSGGEKKKVEILQAMILEPKLIILDELDSGLDVDALKICAESVKRLQKKTGATLVIITHFTKILDYIHPSQVHIVQNGTIVKSGGAGLAKQIEEKGYTEQ